MTLEDIAEDELISALERDDCKLPAECVVYVPFEALEMSITSFDFPCIRLGGVALTILPDSYVVPPWPH